MMKLHILTFFLLCSGFYTAFAQKQIKGKVKDAAGKPLEAVSINLKDPAGDLVSFTRSNAKGEFILQTENKNGFTDFSIEASSIGYKKSHVKLSTSDKVYELIMEGSEIKLETVTVKNRPHLSVNGDTLNYNPADFADKQDRSIGDVLKKMPGMEVAENGKVSYNGKAISNLYIDGDNVLNDKYNIGTKSIPQNIIDKVQVIQNDQPIKMLRKNNVSDDVALNLVTKDNARLKVMGVATAGAGTPDRFNEDLTAMLFKKKVKFVNNIKGNNIGKDPGIDLISHNGLDTYSSNSRPGNFLSTGAAGVPSLPQNRYLFNKAGLINLNNLYNVNKDVQVRANLYYLYDQQRQQYNKFSQTYLQDQTISYTESQNNTIIPQKLRAQFNLTENSDKNYLSNTFSVDYTSKKTNSDFIINNIAADQLLKQQTFNLANDLNYRKKLKTGHMINASSYVNRTTQPETLNITPGLNADILNAGVPYAGLNQYVKAPTWYTNNYASFSLVNGDFVQSYKAGFSLQQQELNTELYLTQNDQRTELSAKNAVNDLDWLKTQSYIEGNYSFTNEKLKISLGIPASYNTINYKDPVSVLNKGLKRFLVNPNLNFKYQTGAENYVTAYYAFRNDLGGIEDVYAGTILRNYRSLFSNDAPVTETSSHNVNTVFNYRKAIQMLFINVTANYRDAKVNTISSYTLSNNIQQRIVLPLANHVKSFSLAGNVSKYLFDLKSTVSGGINFSQSRYEQLQNQELLPFSTQNITYKGTIESRLTKFMNLAYNASYLTSRNKSLSENSVATNYQQLRQQTTLSFTTVKNVYVNLSAEHLFTHQDTQNDLKYLFADMNIKYKILKIKTDLEFGITNLANIKRFDAIYLSSNSLTSGTYQIPGRVAMLKGTFNF